MDNSEGMPRRQSVEVKPENDNSHRRVTLGLMMGALLKEQPLLPGAASAARDHGVNLFCLVGKNLNEQNNFAYQGNILYSLVSPGRFDGVITWTGSGVSMGSYASEEEISRFLDHFRPLPIINLEKAIPDIPTIRTDTFTAMMQVLRHVIGVHHRRKILLVRGPAGHFETEERVRAYHAALAEYGIVFDERLTLPPLPWNVISFESEIGRYIDEHGLEPGVDFDAVAGTEPYHAGAAIRLLQARGVVTPEMVSVVGFNESMESVSILPALTTVRKPFLSSGYQAVELMLKMTAGEPIPPETLVPAELMIRRSCGCASFETFSAESSFEEAYAAEAQSYPFYSSLAELRPDLARRAEQIVTPIIKQLPFGWFDDLWSAFLSDLEGRTHQMFAEIFSRWVSRSVLFEDHLVVWKRVLTLLRVMTGPLLNSDQMGVAKVLWQQGRLCLAEVNLQSNYRMAAVLENQRYFLDLISRDLGNIDQMDGLLDTLSKYLPRVGVPSFYLSMYSDPRRPEVSSRLLLAYRDYQQIPLEAGGVEFPTASIVPEAYLPENRGCTLVVEPLFFRDIQLGILAGEVSEGDGTFFESLQRLISNVTARLMLEQQAREQSAQFQAMAEGAPIGIFVVDLQGRVLYHNPEMDRMMNGVGWEKTICATWGKLAYVDDSERLRGKWEGALEKGEPFEDIGRYQNPSGIYWWDLRIAPIEIDEKTIGYVGMVLDVTESKRYQDHLYHLSVRDGLTGLFNRAFFEETLRRLQREGPFPISVVVVDVDGLKRVNDQLGHAAGDEMLRRTARVLQNTFRMDDVIARMGGDEFAVFLPGANHETLKRGIERLRAHLDEMNAQGGDFQIHLSIGGATTRSHESLVEVVKRADQGMYRQKRKGRQS